jgi:tRNA nucleotidyltransferase (CCA-adding enzyme)
MEFETILEKIRPTKEESQKMFSVQEIVSDALFEAFNQLVHNNKWVTPIIEPVGSFVKETNLAGNSDLDIFLKFPVDYPEEKFKTTVHDKIKIALQSIGATTQTSYASHPYVKAKLDGIDIDVAPCYDVPIGEIKSAVDRTPYHTKFIKKNLQEHQKDEVRLLKQFLKAYELYGANEKYQGFSGYLCELLIYVYGSFLNVLRKELNLFRSQNNPHIPIVLLDPTDIKRNVAAALSWQKFNEFILISRKFLRDYENESDKNVLDVWFDIYEEEPYTKEDVAFFAEYNNTTAYWIEYKSLSNNEEVIYSTARKNLKKIVQLIKQHDFKVYNSIFQVYNDKIIFIIEVEHDKIPYFKDVKGPNIDISRQAFYNWMDSHDNNIFVKEKDFYTEVKREYHNLYNLLQDKLNIALSIERLIYD